jgi:Alkylmercury lyase
MDEADVAFRNLTYRMFVALGRAPTPDEMMEEGDVNLADVAARWQRLANEHALVLEQGTLALRMANPFSAVPTPHRVESAGRWWYANCAWDAFGICAALHRGGRIATTCPDCGDELVVQVRDGLPDNDSYVFHCLVPAAQWWDDIVFT